MDFRHAAPPMPAAALRSGGEFAPPTPVPPPRILQPPPLLASDILREEVAPLAPARSALRALLLPLAVGFAAWGVAACAGWIAPGDRLTVISALLASAAATLAALIPASYAARAAFAALTGLVPLVVGATG